jgi:hypothetical protein
MGHRSLFQQYQNNPAGQQGELSEQELKEYRN